MTIKAVWKNTTEKYPRKPKDRDCKKQRMNFTLEPSQRASQANTLTLNFDFDFELWPLEL